MNRRSDAAAPARARTTRFAAASAWMDRLPQPVAVSLVVVVVLGLWQALVSFGGVSEIILPSPLSVGEQIVEVVRQLVMGDFLLGQLWITVQEIVLGFLIASLAGFLIGLWIGQTEFGRKAVMPLFVVVEASPKIAFTPVFIAWFGFGISSKFLMAAFMSIFPVIINTAAGMNAAGAEEIRLFRSMRASSWEIFWKLKFPRALPFIFAGLKIAIVSAVTGAVAAEFIGGGVGFGEQVRVAASRIALDRVFALILVLSMLGLALFGLVSLAQRRFAFWDLKKDR
ncbi:ABC transporter permease [Brevibacterium album]|uniref:ABC transporter permease n=1 Tax=Brevibacterium album TaxID=417948 RepID=UPI0003FE7695|nr:ABC transporter permease [Brevibacterium album]